MFKNKSINYSFSLTRKSFSKNLLKDMKEVNNSKKLNVPEFMPVLNNRWSPRAFSDKNVEDKDLKVLFEAARWAPSCFNEQPWNFIYGSKLSSKKAYDFIFNSLVPQNQAWANSAPVLIVPCAKISFKFNGKENNWAMYDVGQAVGSIILQASHMGLYSHQMAGVNLDSLTQSFSIPSDFKPICVMALGYLGELDRIPQLLAEKEGLPRERKELKSFVFNEVWGDSKF